MSQTKAQLIDPVDGTIVNADINASAAIAGSKISPAFTSNITGTGDLTIDTNTLHVDSSNNRVGIGTTSPVKAFHNALDTTLITGTAPQIRLNGNANDGSDNDRAIFGLATSNSHFFSSSSAGDAILRTTATGKLLFGTGTAEHMRLDSAGRVLIGTTTEGYTTADDFTIAGSGDCGMTIRSGTSSQSAIAFSDATSGNAEFAGQISYYHSSDELVLTANTSQIVKIHDEHFNILAAEGTLRMNFGFQNGLGGELSIYDQAGSQKTRITGSANTNHFFNNGGNVGIGLNNPDTLLHLAGGSPNIKLHNTGTSASENDVFGALIFQHSDSDDAGITAKIECVAEDNAGNSRLAFHNGDGGNADERMRIASDGAFMVGTTTARTAEFSHPDGVSIRGDVKGQYQSTTTDAMNMLLNRDGTDGQILSFRKDGTDIGNIGVSGSDIYFQFGSTGSASHRLDDYEEGTWTPALTSGFFSGNTYTVQSGTYVKIGGIVHAFFFLQFNAMSTSGGTIRINSPFTMLTGDNHKGSGIVSYHSIQNASASHTFACYQQNSTNIQFYAGAGTALSATAHTVQNGQYLIGYFTVRTP